jgi:hypothetical protein
LVSIHYVQGSVVTECSSQEGTLGKSRVVVGAELLVKTAVVPVAMRNAAVR